MPDSLLFNALHNNISPIVVCTIAAYMEPYSCNHALQPSPSMPLY